MRWFPSALFRRARRASRQPLHNNYRPTLEPLETRVVPSTQFTPASLDFSSGFGGSSALVKVNGSTKVSGALLNLTDGGAVEPIAQFASDAVARERPIRGATATWDRDVEEVFYSVDYEGQTSSTVWLRPRTMETVSRCPVIGSAVNMIPETSGRTIRWTTTARSTERCRKPFVAR